MVLVPLGGEVYRSIHLVNTHLDSRSVAVRNAQVRAVCHASCVVCRVSHLACVDLRNLTTARWQVEQAVSTITQTSSPGDVVIASGDWNIVCGTSEYTRLAGLLSSAVPGIKDVGGIQGRPTMRRTVRQQHASFVCGLGLA